MPTIIRGQTRGDDCLARRRSAPIQQTTTYSPDLLLRRKPGTPRSPNSSYWRENHGPPVAKHATTLNICAMCRFTLSKTQSTTAGGGARQDGNAYDGVAELWWTNRDSLMAGFTGAGREAGEELVQDEAGSSICRIPLCGSTTNIRRSIRAKIWSRANTRRCSNCSSACGIPRT